MSTINLLGSLKNSRDTAILTAIGASTLTAGYARIRSAAQGAAGPGIVDLDVGTAGTSVILNTVSIANGSPVSVTSATITEG